MRVVPRLDQLAIRADGRQARVEVDAFFSVFCLRVLGLKIVVPRTAGCQDSLYV